MVQPVVHDHARAKINLALNVTGRRADGYHLLDSLVAFADCGDRLSFTLADRDQLTMSGPFANALPADGTNIVMKAVLGLRQLAAAHGYSLPPVAVSLEKNLPVASGIGGGSADAAATLRGLIALADLHLDHNDLADLAVTLGADVPVCLAQEYCRMRGIGETVTVMGPPPAPAVVLLNPLVAQSTQAVFQKLGLGRGNSFSGEVDVARPHSWRNDLATAALTLTPVIADVLTALRGMTSLTHVRMSGSGATCFGLADRLDDAARTASILSNKFPQWWVGYGRLY